MSAVAVRPAPRPIPHPGTEIAALEDAPPGTTASVPGGGALPPIIKEGTEGRPWLLDSGRIVTTSYVYGLGYRSNVAEPRETPPVTTAEEARERINLFRCAGWDLADLGRETGIKAQALRDFYRGKVNWRSQPENFKALSGLPLPEQTGYALTLADRLTEMAFLLSHGGVSQIDAMNRCGLFWIARTRHPLGVAKNEARQMGLTYVVEVLSHLQHNSDSWPGAELNDCNENSDSEEE